MTPLQKGWDAIFHEHKWGEVAENDIK